MQKNHSTIAVIIAALNEEKGIGSTIFEIKKVLDDPFYIVVDGNSSDKTAQEARRVGAKVIIQKGSGKGQAIAQGLQSVNSDTRYVVFTDADFTYPAKYIPKMIKILHKNPHVGMVSGNRFDKRFVLKNAINNTYYFGNRLLAFIQYLLNGVKLRDPLSGLRVVRWEVLQGWRPQSKGFEIETELNNHVQKKGYHVMEIPILYRQRIGEKKLKLRHGFAILKRILSEFLTLKGEF